MIYNYNSFISDLLFESINESCIYYLHDFRNILNRLNNEIAKDLLSIERQDIDPDVTFISLCDKDGSVSFSQMDNSLRNIKSYLSKNYSDDIIDPFINRVKNGEFKDIDHYNNNHNFMKYLSRNEIKLGRLVNKIFPGKYSVKEVEDFVNLFKSRITGTTKEMILVEGEEIRKWYNENTYEDIVGELGNSCMRYGKCAEYLDIYVHNPEVCRLLICKHFDKIVGRALVWKLHEVNIDPKPEFFMDRIYTTDDSIKILFTDYADENGWLKRSSSTCYDCKSFKLGNIQYDDEHISVKLNKFDFEYYPYMDTLKTLDISKGILLNEDEDDDSEYGYLLTNTDGTFTDLNTLYSDYYDEFIPRDEAVYSDFHGSYIWKRNSIEVKLGRHKGFYPEDSIYLILDKFRNEYFNRNECLFTDIDDCFFYTNDSVNVIIKIKRSFNEFGEVKLVPIYSITSKYSKKIINMDKLDPNNDLISNIDKVKRYKNIYILKSIVEEENIDIQED